MVKYPQMRQDLISTIRKLADPEYQRKVWVDHQFPEGVEYDSFDLAISILLDDTALVEEPETHIGVILVDIEGIAIRPVIAAAAKSP
jgi:hypothetical protein